MENKGFDNKPGLKLNILYYIPFLRKEHGGIYQYAIALLKILTNDQTNHYFVLNVNDNGDVRSIIAGKKNFTLLTENDYINIERPRLLTRIRLSYYYRNRFERKYIARDGNLHVLLAKYGIEIIHSPTQNIPVSEIPMIGTMHDVQELHFPAFFSSGERANRAVRHKYVIDKARKIVVSYDHVKNDLVRFFGKPPDDIHTILLDMENLWIDRFICNGYVPKKSPIVQKFILYPAATWEHKNHRNLITAVSYLKEKKGVSMHVVFTGNKTSNFSSLQTLIDDLEMSRDFTFMGIVDDETLFNLYMNAHGVVVPTLYEAGSFPLMESILLKRPVICSNVTSLPETIGDLEFTFDPNDVEGMAHLIYRLWADEEFRRRNADAIARKSETVRFNDCLTKFLALYNSLN